MKKFVLVTICLVAVIVCNAQNNRPEQNSLLWRISGEGLKAPSYLFGTCHLICKEDYSWTDEMKKALGNCKELCLEMNIDDPTAMQKIMQGMAETSGKKLKDYFTSQQYTDLENFMNDSIHVPLSMFESMKPAALLGIMENYALNCSTTPASYEMNLIKTAKENKQVITGFETAEEMLTLLYKIPGDSIIHGILMMLHDFGENRAYHKKIIEAYKQQNVEAIYDIVHNAGALGSNEVFLVDNRNRNWMTQMKDKMPKSPVFFAVGAGHLGGGNGLIALLRKEGYTVEAIK